MTTEDSAMVDALADACRDGHAGDGAAPTGFFGVFKRRSPLLSGDGGQRPAEPLINEVTWHFRTLSTPAAMKIGMIDRNWKKKSSPGRQQAAIGHTAQARLIAGGSAHPSERMAHLRRSAVAEAPYGKDDEVSAAELAAIERLRELPVLMAERSVHLRIRRADRSTPDTLSSGSSLPRSRCCADRRRDSRHRQQERRTRG